MNIDLRLKKLEARAPSTQQVMVILPEGATPVQQAQIDKAEAAGTPLKVIRITLV